MSRVPKNGLKYSPHDTNIHSDRKIKRLIKCFGGDGYTAYDYIKCLIYGDLGYYMIFTEDLYFDVADIFPDNVDEIFINKVVEYCFVVELFNRDMKDKFSILTSAGIQRRWLEISKLSKRKNQIIKNEYCLVEECFKNNSGRNADNSGRNADNSGRNADNSGRNATNNISLSLSNNKGIDTKGNKEGINKIYNDKEEEEKIINTEGMPLNTEGMPLNTEGMPLNTEGMPLNTENINHYGPTTFHIPTDPEICKKFYLSHPSFETQRSLTYRLLENYFKTEDRVIFSERFEMWLDEFNDYLNLDHVKKPLTGKNSYPGHFHNWMGTQGDKLKIKPNGRIKRFDNQANRSLDIDKQISSETNPEELLRLQKIKYGVK